MRWSAPQPYEELDHTADCGLRVQGASPEELIARLVLAFGALLTADVPTTATFESPLRVPPADHPAMAVDVLRELLYRFDVEHIVPQAVEGIVCDPTRGTELVVTFGAYDPEKHIEGLTLKAVTLHGARFEQVDGVWIAEVIFDL